MKKKTKNGIIKIHTTNGFGNNLFQYVFGRLLAEKNGLKFSYKYSIPEIGLKKSKISFTKELPLKKIRNATCSKIGWWRKYLDENKRLSKKKNYYLVGYFEDYVLYKPYLDKIRSWFNSVENCNLKDLVLHVRLGDRLLCDKSHEDFVSAESYKKVIDSFSFDKLYIVTDSKQWEPYTKKDIKKLRTSTHRRTIPKRKYKIASVNKSLDYVNALIDGLSCYNPIVHGDTLINDFNFIRSFDNIIVHNSTFAWWAAVLSNASRIGVYKPWKPSKGKRNRNKNLGQTDYPGWFQWE